MNAIEVNQLNKQFGPHTIFADLSFIVEKGEFVAIVGPSGSGKSTLLNILGMLEPTSGGQIKIFDQPLPQINSRQAMMLRREKINYLFQSFALITNKTVYENLLFALYFTKMSSKEKKLAIERVLTALDLKDYEKSVVATLSGGEQQRIALARAILKPGELILADEPTGALDPVHAQAAFNQIKDLRDKYGKTVVMVTHNIEEAKQTDRIIDLGSLQ